MIHLYYHGYVWADWGDYRDKSFWMIAELVIIPISLAGFAYYLEKSERIEDRRINIDNQRERKQERYIDFISELIKSGNISNIFGKEHVRKVVQLKTNNTLNFLDNKRRSEVIKFLSDAGLVQRIKGQKKTPYIDLSNLDLSGISLSGFSLEGANFQKSKLRDASFKYVNLSNADFRESDLYNSRFELLSCIGVKMFDADLRKAEFLEVYLENACFVNTNLQDAIFDKVSFSKKTIFNKSVMPDGEIFNKNIHDINHLSKRKF